VTAPPVDFVLALHSHLPYVLNHGRWPHGSDWICEAAIDTYLPLLDALQGLQAEGVPTPVTIGITPVLANQFDSPVFATELETYFGQRLTTCDEADASLAATDDGNLGPLAGFWKTRLLGLRNLFRRLDGDLTAAFRRLESDGRIELMSSAATHGFLPLLARDESIRLQLGLGRAEHRRIFGRAPDGVWLPECAYRPRGAWAPLPEAPRSGIRRGIEEHVADAGFVFFFVDSHMAGAGQAFPLYGAEGHVPAEGEPRNSPYRAYRVASHHGAVPTVAFVRDPASSKQVWSRYEGYPGDEWYLEFHKIRWPGGLKYWRVSAPGTDLGQKRPYEPDRALERAATHGRHFAGLLEQIAAAPDPGSGRERGRSATRDVIAVPFDTELFGHWWHEGVDFLAQVYRTLPAHPSIRPCTARDHLARVPPGRGVHLAGGSWGANGDFGMWLNPGTTWMWQRLWAIESRFWDRAGGALVAEPLHGVLAQAAREMLLAMASDWPFIISTGSVGDYAARRFTEHCTDAEFLLSALEPGAPQLAAAQDRAAELWSRDQVFPGVLAAVRAALTGSRAMSV
jgi:1,4-alpha-glucan branching enzyme